DFGHGGGDAHDRLADRRAFAAKPVMALGILSVSIAGFLCGMAHRRAPPGRAACRSCRPPCPGASPVLGSLAGGAHIRRRALPLLAPVGILAYPRPRLALPADGKTKHR